MDEVTHFIQAVGFPVLVALILLVRVDRMHVENIKAIHALTILVSDLHRCVEALHSELAKRNTIT